jgi:alkyl hydroperoxide reductase subunit AhpC
VATLLPIANNLSGWPMCPPGRHIGLPGWAMSSAGMTSTSLSDWLGDRWAILFSHPDDFVSYDLEMDRWLVITRQAFAERGIQPIALASPALDPQHCWVTQVSGDNRAVLLEDPAQQHLDGSVDSQTLMLREAITRLGQRFALIIDSTLHIQKVFTYSVPSRLPSPLELLGWAEALRARQAAPTPRTARHCPRAARSRIMRATRKVPVRDLIGTRCKTAAAPATVTGK